MKERNGFVSNSSSSSFLIALSKNKSIKDLFNRGFTTEELVTEGWNRQTNSFEEKTLTPEFVLEQLELIIKNDSETNTEKILEDIFCGSIHVYSGYTDPRRDETYFSTCEFLYWLTEDEKKEIFGEDETIGHFNREAKDRLYPQIKKRAVEYFESLGNLVQPEWRDYYEYDNDGKLIRDEENKFDKDMKLWAQRVLKKFMKENPGHEYILLSFGDESEMSRFFQYQFEWEKRVPTLRISHH